MGSKRNKCCCENCKIGGDDFNRADASTLGSGWTDASGDWSIVSNEASKASGASLVVFDTPHPTPSGSMIVRYNITNPVNGATYGVIVNYKDASNYHVAEYYHDSSGGTTPTISLHKVSAGSKTLIKTEDVVGITGNTIVLFNATIAANEFCAGVDNAVYGSVYDKTTLITDGIYSGMSGDSSVATTYDDFEFRHHSETLAGCGNCICTCNQNYVPPTLNVSITGFGPRMSGLSCSGTLEWIREDLWWLTTTTIDCTCMTVELKLTCPANEQADSFALDILQGCADSNPDGSSGLLPESDATCSPLYLRYRVIVGETDLACTCGTPETGIGNSWWDIEITI